MINKINKDIYNIINIHYRKHKTENTVHILEQLFCINKAVLKINNNTLNIV